MAEDVSDLLEAGSLSHHAAGHRVPEHVGAGERRVDRRPAERAGHDTRDGRARQRLAATISEVLVVDVRVGVRPIFTQYGVHDSQQLVGGGEDGSFVAGTAFAGAGVVARGHPGPGAEMTRLAEGAQVRSDLDEEAA